jgi:hypothetical protein
MSGSSWFSKRSETEMRRVTAETLFDLEMECRRQGWGADPALVYNEEHDLFRFRDGQFAFSRQHVNRELLKKRGRSNWIGLALSSITSEVLDEVEGAPLHVNLPSTPGGTSS